MPTRKKAIGLVDGDRRVVFEPRIPEDHPVTNEPTFDYDLNIAIALARRTGQAIEAMSGTNWTLNSTQLKANLVASLEYIMAALEQVRDAAE